MASREIPAKWSNDPAFDLWAERPYRPLRHRSYWRFWWRTNAKAAAISILFWVLFAWIYLKFMTR